MDELEKSEAENANAEQGGAQGQTDTAAEPVGGQPGSQPDSENPSQGPVAAKAEIIEQPVYYQGQGGLVASGSGPQTPAWYPDPQGVPGRMRYWDGTRWTEHFQDAPVQANPYYQQQAANQQMATQAVTAGSSAVTATSMVVIIVCIVVLVVILLPACLFLGTCASCTQAWNSAMSGSGMSAAALVSSVLL